MSEVLEIINEFQISGTPQTAEPFGGGHINKTYKVTTAENLQSDYLLQKINHEVFNDVEGLMQNISKATKHIKNKVSSAQPHVLTIVPTKQDELIHREQESYWRVFEFLGEACSYDKAETEKHAFEAAKMFGMFFKDLSDFPVEELHITIPDFHNIGVRLKQLDEALANAKAEFVKRAKKEIAIIDNYRSLALELYPSGDMPLRVTHNDTKFNNVLLESNGNGYAVIDLDTIMPGYVFFDVGDGIRTGIVTAKEDEQDLDGVQISEAKYKAYLKGYLAGAGDILTGKELHSIPLAGFYMAFIMGIRFLTDYLKGNIYFSVNFADHNFYRARCQLHVAKLLKNKAGEMQKFISDIS